MIAMNRNKLIKIGLSISLVIGLVALFVYGSLCKLDGNNVCFDKSEERFRLEENATLKVAVESEATKEHLLSVWNTLYPKHEISVEVVDAMNRTELSEPSDFDLFYVDGNDAMYFMPLFKNLGQGAQAVIAETVPIGLQDSYNINGLKFVPQNVKGQSLYLNQTLLEEMELTREDVASFEKIKENQDHILSFVNTTFPFSFKSQDTFYPFLTGGGWTLNYKHDGMDPDFNTEAFLNSLEFIQYLGGMKLNSDEEKIAGMDLPYNYESDFFKRQSLFGYIQDVELAEQYAAVSSDVWVEIPFPSYNDHVLAQAVEINGYAVNVESSFPSASAEVLRILRLPEFLDKGLSDRYPLYNLEMLEDLDIDPTILDKISIFGHGDVSTILALEVNPSVRSNSIYTDLDFMEVLAKVYDGELEPLDAQEVFVQMGADWILSHTPPSEEDSE